MRVAWLIQLFGKREAPVRRVRQRDGWQTGHSPFFSYIDLGQSVAYYGQLDCNIPFLGRVLVAQGLVAQGQYPELLLEVLAAKEEVLRHAMEQRVATAL